MKKKYSRAKKGIVVSVIGSAINVILASVKISIGLIAGSISVLLDGFNNFTDIFTAGATAVGFGVADMKNNKKYPHGYARIEYIISLLVAIVVIVVGIGFLFSAIERILVPQPVGFSWIYFAILAFTVLVKVAMGEFYRRSNKKMNSMPLKVLSLDSYQDAAITSFVLLTFGLSRVTGLPIDALCAILMAIIIFINCSKLAAKSFKALLGEVDEILYNKIMERVNNDFEAQDLRIYDYGYNNLYGTVTIKVNKQIPLEKVVVATKTIEQDVLERFNLKLKISIDIL